MIVVGVKYIASVSFGKDSLAMLLKLIEENKPIDKVVFYDTGMEFQSIYNLRDKLQPIIDSYGAEYIELKPNEPFLYSMLERKVNNRSKDGFHYGYSWCGGTCRWGTTEKLKAIRNYKKSLNDDYIDYVGIAYDEPHRFDKAKSEGKQLPLVDWKMTEADCLVYCRSKGYSWIEHTSNSDIDLYDILDRVSCWCCRNKNLDELRNIYKYLPEYWEKLKIIQSKIAEPMKGKNKSVFDLEKRFEFEDKWLKNGNKLRTKDFYNSLREIYKYKNGVIK